MASVSSWAPRVGLVALWLSGASALNVGKLSRRGAVFGAGAAALPKPAAAIVAGYKNINGGFGSDPDRMATVQAGLFDALTAALQRKDYAAAASLYLPGATIVDGTGSGKPNFVRGADAADLL